MLESVATADGTPVDDVVLSSLVLGMAVDTRLVAKGPVQALLVQDVGMTVQAPGLGHAGSRNMAVRAPLGMIVLGMPFVELPGRHPKVIDGPSPGSSHQDHCRQGKEHQA